jgi:hypothetical protein
MNKREEVVKGRTIIKTILFCAALVACRSSFAQGDFEKARYYWSELSKNKTNMVLLDSARFFIDKAFTEENIRSNARANLMRGAIYKEVYRYKEAGDYNSPSRKLSVESFMNSFNLDTTGMNRDIVRQQLKWVAVQFNNDAKNALEKYRDFPAAEANFKEFKKLILICDPSFNIASKELEFELALGTAYEDKAANTGRKEFLDLAKVTYLTILDRDSLNGDANFKIGAMYYNQGANIIMKTLNFDTPIDSVVIYEEWANKLFKQAEPFMLRAWRAHPNCLKILEGLSGIYYSLNEEERFQKFKALFDKLKENIEKGLIKEDC